jgi:hypothetical protein
MFNKFLPKREAFVLSSCVFFFLSKMTLFVREWKMGFDQRRTGILSFTVISHHLAY